MTLNLTTMLSKPAMKVFGIALFSIGLIIFYVVRRRKFNRRTMTGAEGFSSYEKAWLTRLFEGVLLLISWFLMLGGVSAIILAYG